MCAASHVSARFAARWSVRRSPKGRRHMAQKCFGGLVRARRDVCFVFWRVFWRVFVVTLNFQTPMSLVLGFCWSDWAGFRQSYGGRRAGRRTTNDLPTCICILSSTGAGRKQQQHHELDLIDIVGDTAPPRCSPAAAESGPNGRCLGKQIGMAGSRSSAHFSLPTWCAVKHVPACCPEAAPLQEGINQKSPGPFCGALVVLRVHCSRSNKL